MDRFINFIFILFVPVLLLSCTEKEPEIPEIETIPVESISLNQTTASITIGETLMLSASVSPSNATDKDITWSSSNQSIASVSGYGLVTAVGEGTATITAMAANGESVSCIVTTLNITPKNQIWYTTASGTPVEVSASWSGNRIVSNTYGNGKGVIVFEKNLRTIPSDVFCERNLTTVEIPEGVEEIGSMVFYNCHNLVSAILPSSLKTIGSRVFTGCENIERVDLNATEPPICGIDDPDTGGYGPLGRPYNKDLFTGKLYIPDEAAEDYARSLGWKDYLSRLFTKSGKPLTSFVYKSTDYSKDGEVVLLQKATVGRGVNFLFLGDGFIDKDMESGGLYEQKMRRGMEVLFCWEPFKTFRDRFNIYTIKKVSSSNSYALPGIDRCFSSDVVGDTTPVSLIDNYESILSRLEDIPNPYNTPINIIVLYNTDLAIGGNPHASWRKTWGAAICYAIESIPHEVGHSFGWLDEEYIHSDNLTEDDLELLKEGMTSHHNDGEYTNNDYRSDPSEVLWSHFISDPRYSDEGIGVFQGASESSKYLYRPTFDSIMRIRGPFNAPSREAIYKHIMQYSEGESWTYDYEEFVKADAAGHKQWMSHLKPDGYMKQIEYPK